MNHLMNLASETKKNMFLERSKRATAIFVAALLVAASPALAQIDQLYTSSGGGNWTDTGNWTQGTGADSPDYPVAGDAITWQNAKTFSADHAFGHTSITSSWPTTDQNYSGNTLTSTQGVFHLTGGLRRFRAGEFINAAGATFIHDISSSGSYIGFTPDVFTIRNRGTVIVREAVAGVGRMQLFQTGVFVNENGAILQGEGVALSPQLTTCGGCTFTGESGSIYDAPSGQNFQISAGSSSTSKIQDGVFRGDGVLDFRGSWSEVSGSREAGSTVDVTIQGSFNVTAAGTLFNVSDANGNTAGIVVTNAGNVSINTAAGEACTNRGVFTINGTGWVKPNQGAGEFVNDTGATFRHNHPGTMYIQGGTFRNKGTLYWLSNAGISLFSTTTSFVNEDGGIIVKTNGTGSISGGGDDTFDNDGTLRVTDGATINVSSGIATTPQFSGNTLSGGTWEAIGAGSTLNYNPANAGITTIDTGADVLISGSTASLAELTTGSLTVNGTFRVADQKIHALTGLTAGGTLGFGLEAADEGGTLTTGIDVTGNVDFTGGTVGATNLGDMVVGTYRIIEWTGTETGTLSLATPLLGETLGVSLSQDNGGNFVELIVSDASAPVGTVIVVK